MTPAPDADKISALNAIHVLLETAESMDGNTLDDLMKKLPNVSSEFLTEVKESSVEALQRKVLIQADWLGAFYRSLDGIKEIRHMMGSQSEGSRDPDAIRLIVDTLVLHCPWTWEDSPQGRHK